MSAVTMRITHLPDGSKLQRYTDDYGEEWLIHCHDGLRERIDRQKYDELRATVAENAQVREGMER